MKKIITLFVWIIVLFSSQIGFAQLRGINYQAVAVDENGVEVVGVDNTGQLRNNLSMINPDFNQEIIKLVDEVGVDNCNLLNPVNWDKL